MLNSIKNVNKLIYGENTMKAIYFIFLVILLTTISLTGCSPASIKIAEEVIEDVASEELKGA